MTIFKKTLIAAAAAIFAFGAAAADEAQVIYYGFAPQNPLPEEVTAHGTGKNSFINGAICLNAESDPLLKRIEGNRVVGVRCFLRQDYKQKSKKFSGIWWRNGSLDESAVLTYCDFAEGWNEVYFDEPAEISETPLYVGLMVYETKGSPYPLVSYSKASVNEGCYIKAGNEAFEEYTSRGTLLIEAIIEASDEDTHGNAFAQADNWPLAVEPETQFPCNLYIRNQGAQPIESLTITTQADNGASVRSYDIALDEPIGAYDGIIMPYELVSPATEGESTPLSLQVTAINGAEANPGKINAIGMYISQDAFVRIPLIEEFTSLMCVNCPFMAYYLDEALEKFGPDHAYVAHHAGFLDDDFTTDVDNELLYLFNTPSTYNPAAMFDRRVLAGNNAATVSATQASSEPYELNIAEVMQYPAMARVEIDMNVADGKAACRVHGKLAKAMVGAADGIYVSAYLVENGIAPVGPYRQSGVSYDMADDAPADLPEKFKHNGVIRINFCTDVLGDKIAVDEEGYFDMDMGVQDVAGDWKIDNCQAIAFVHRINLDNIGDNYVLNAGYRNLGEPASAIDAAVAQAKLWLDDAGYARCSITGQKVELYDAQGRRISRAATPGLYIAKSGSLSSKLLKK